MLRSAAQRNLPRLLRDQPCPAPDRAQTIEVGVRELVHNVDDTQADRVFGQIDSWQVWYERATGLTFSRHFLCAASRCGRPAEWGTHVAIEGRPGIWILPQCSNCKVRESDSLTTVIPGTLAALRARDSVTVDTVTFSI